MGRVTLYILFILLFYSCGEDCIMDNGSWRPISSECDSLVDEYTLINGKIYYGTFDANFVSECLEKHNIVFFTDVDIATFEVCQGTDYARDKRNVYYPIEIKCVEGWEYGGCYATKYIIAKARPDKFKYIREGYAVSGKHMFYEGEEIVWREDILNDEIPITDSVINQNVLKEKNLLEKLKDINYEISRGL